MKIKFIEGARNVGKTFLINSLNNIQVYKFPFAKYFNDSYSLNKDPLSVNSNPELFFLTLGYDITILDLCKQGIIKDDIIVDRGILSDIIFGIQSGRITMQTGIDAWNWLFKEYGEYFEIIYIHADIKKDERGKDMWTIYSQSDTDKIYNEFVNTCNINMKYYKNNFDNISVDNFSNFIK